MPDPYESIATKTGFIVPELYRRLVDDGLTRYGATRDEWKQTWKQRTLEDPPALLLVSMHVEWWSPEAIAENEHPDYWRAELNLVPFAQNGAGDLWCWHGASPEAEIVFAAHDENEASIFAPDLAGFLFRHLVQGLSEMYEDDGTDFTREQRVAAAKANVRVLAPYLTPARVAILDELCSRPLIHDASWGCLRLISRDEAKALVSRELGYSRLDETFQHMTS